MSNELLPGEIQEETQRLRTFGLRVPDSGFLLEHPYAPPLTRRSYVVPSAWHWDSAPGSVDPKSLQIDLPVLKLAMELAYAGWERAGSQGWDWHEFFFQWNASLARQTGDRISCREAFGPWKTYSRFLLDNHSGPRLGTGWQSLSTTVLFSSEVQGAVTRWKNTDGVVGEFQGNEPASKPWNLYMPGRNGDLAPRQAMSHPAHFGTWEAIEAGQRWIPVETANGWEAELALSVQHLLGREASENVGYAALSSSVGYLRVATPVYGSPALQTYDFTTLETLVVDLRGNHGGAADSVLAMLQPVLKIAGIRADSAISMRWKRSVITTALQWGHAQQMLHRHLGPLPSYRRLALQSLVDQLLLPEAPVHEIEWLSHRSERSYAQRPLHSPSTAHNPKLVILTDGQCVSDGEFLVYLLAQIPGSVVVGVNTGGVGEFARPGYFVLPQTRIGFRLATGISDFYGDGRSFDGYGLCTDILPPQDRPLDRVTLLRLVSSIRGQRHKA